MRITNHNNFPEALVRAVSATNYDRGDADFTVTELILPPRILALRRQYEDQIEVDVADLMYSAMGQGFHTLMERSERMGIAEERLYGTFEGTRISGKFDAIALESAEAGWHLYDYKQTSVWSVVADRGTGNAQWVAQLNLLGWLMAQNDRPVASLSIVAALRDWSKNKAKHESGYPQAQAQLIPIVRWPTAETEFYLRKRIEAHRATTLPLCTDEERWSRPDTYAVMKTGLKRAQRVFDNAEDANAFAAPIGKAYVEKRPGQRVRCESYCDVAPFCSQWQAEIASAGESEPAA